MGGITLPPAAQQRAHIARRLAWMERRTGGKHAKGTNIIPFSLHHIDELLSDMGMPLSPLQRLKQWLLPVDPSDYAFLERELRARRASTRRARRPKRRSERVVSG